MSIAEIWAIIQPYVTAIFSTSLGAFLLAFLTKYFTSKIVNKNNIKNITDKVSTSIADTVVGSDIQVDLTAFTDTKLTEIDKCLQDKVNVISNCLDKQTMLLIDLCTAWSNSKTLTAEQKEKMLADVKALTDTMVVTEPKKVITLKVEKKELEQAENAPQDEKQSIMLG